MVAIILVRWLGGAAIAGAGNKESGDCCSLIMAFLLSKYINDVLFINQIEIEFFYTSSLPPYLPFMVCCGIHKSDEFWFFLTLLNPEKCACHSLIFKQFIQS